MKPREKEMQTGKSTPISPSFSQQPWLLQLRGTKERTVRFVNPLNGNIEEQSVPEMQGKVCLGCFGEWVLLLQRKSKGMSLLNLASLDEIMLPAIPEPLESLGCFALSSSPSSSNKCVVVTVSTEHNFILCCTLRDHNWTKIDPISHVLYSGEIAVCRGRIYALLKSHAIAVIDLESLPTGAVCGEIVSLPESFSFRNSNTTHLVASSETIFSISVSIPSGLVTDLHIYKLDTCQLSSRKFELLKAAASRSSNSDLWARTGSIDNRVFLLSEDYSISVSANRARMQCNCMYLLQQNDDGLRLCKICLDDQTTTSRVLIHEENNAWNKFYWVVPSRFRNIKSKKIIYSSHYCGMSILFVKDVERTSDISVSWTDMPLEIVQELLLYLPLPDRIRLASVCKFWNSFSKYVRGQKVFPWLMSSSDCGSLNMFDYFYRVKHCLQMEWLRSHRKLTFHCSKDGWFIASDRNSSIFILNPLTRQVIKLPPMCRYDMLRSSFSFSSIPTNSNCIVLAVVCTEYQCVLNIWHRGRSSWKEEIISLADNPFSHVPVSPVFFCDEFYILGSKGDLLVFNPTTKKRQFLDTLAPVNSEGILKAEKEECYLLELDGDLIYVFKRNNIETYSVYKLDQTKTVWTELDSLGDMTAFLSCFGSMSRPSKNGLYANGMFFLRLYGEANKKPVFYSMQNHAFEQNLEGAEDFMNSVWFEPNLFVRRNKGIKKMFTHAQAFKNV